MKLSKVLQWVLLWAGLVGHSAFVLQRAATARSPRAFMATTKSPFSYQNEVEIEGTIFSGDPTDNAKKMNHREIIRQSFVLNASGRSVSLGSLMDNKAIVVFLRSLG